MSDESTRQRMMSALARHGDGRRRLVKLDAGQCLGLLASVEYGRIVFTHHGLPAIQPVNHLIDDGQIIVRTRLAAKVATADTVAGDIVVAYHAHQFDPAHRLSGSVVATAVAHPLTDPTHIAWYEQFRDPWVDTAVDAVARLRPRVLTGFRLTTGWPC